MALGTRAYRAKGGWRLLVLAAIAVPAVVLPLDTAAQKPPREIDVVRWIEVTLDEIVVHRINPPRAARSLALVSVAAHDAAIRGTPGRNARIAGAASAVLTYLFPDERARFEREAWLMSTSHPGAFGTGLRVAERVIARARSDGSAAQWTGSYPAATGLWVPTPPAFSAPVEPLAGSWRTWNLRSGSLVRPAPPLRFESDLYRAQTREVYDVGRSLTPEQKRIADFWADGVGTVTPPGHWNAIAVDLVRRRKLSPLASARVFATLNTAQADAFIACWDAKFAYWTERPVTAIQREIDSSWTPYITTPPFPSYVSGHSSTSGAASVVLARFFPAAAARLRAQAAEAAVSRLYGGIHFRFDNETGFRLGQRVGRVALKSRFARAKT